MKRWERSHIKFVERIIKELEVRKQEEKEKENEGS